jgi:hypothetical protein
MEGGQCPLSIDLRASAAARACLPTRSVGGRKSKERRFFVDDAETTLDSVGISPLGFKIGRS